MESGEEQLSGALILGHVVATLYSALLLLGVAGTQQCSDHKPSYSNTISIRAGSGNKMAKLEVSSSYSNVEKHNRLKIWT